MSEQRKVKNEKRVGMDLMASRGKTDAAKAAKNAKILPRRRGDTEEAMNHVKKNDFAETTTATTEDAMTMSMSEKRKVKSEKRLGMTSVFGRWAAAAAVFAGVAFALVPNEAEAWAWVQAWADHTSQTFYVGDTPCFSWWFNSDGTGASYKSWSLDKGTRSWKYGDSYIYKDSGEDGSNNQWETTGIQVTSSGTWYYSLWLGWGNSVGDNGHYYNYASGSWSEGSSSVITSTFTVNALNNPTAGTLTPSKNQIVVNWTKGTSGVAKDTLVVRSTSSTKPTPVGGTEYNAGDTIGTGYTVVYRGGDTSVTDTGLSAGTTYYYYFFAENYKYYSSGVSKSAKTLAVPTAGRRARGASRRAGRR